MSRTKSSTKYDHNEGKTITLVNQVMIVLYQIHGGFSENDVITKVKAAEEMAEKIEALAQYFSLMRLTQVMLLG